MRVLFLNHNVVGSGTFSRAFHLARQLAGRDYDVTLITTSRRARWSARSYERDRVEIIEAPDLLAGRGRTGWDPYNTWMRTGLVRKRTFDLVHAFDSRPAVIYPALHAVARCRALFVMDWADWWGRGGWIHDRSGWLMRTSFGPIETWFEEAYRTRAHGMTVASRALRDRSIEMGVAPDRIELMPGGCEPSILPTQPRNQARDALGIPADLPLVVHVGVLTRGDYAFLRDAFARVQVEQPRARLMVIGRTGIRLPSVDLGSAIRTTGPVDDATLRSWLSAANLCVIPCRDTIGNRGRWPSKVNDYLSFGRAVVMPRVSDAAITVEQGAAGWVTEPAPEAFAAGIIRALSNVIETDAAGARGRAIAEGELAWQRLGARLVEFYDRVSAAQ
jgi:glycosyltransferase involved in cell wall biosynthesis